MNSNVSLSRRLKVRTELKEIRKKGELQTFEEIVFTMWSSAARMASEFSYVQSCDLEANVQIKICTMEGSLPPLELEELLQNQLLQFCGRKQSKVPDFMIEAVVLGKTYIYY